VREGVRLPFERASRQPAAHAATVTRSISAG
jgi:hypothetical protein